MEERRKTKRFATNLKAHYFLKEGEGKECTVINISRNGVGLEFYTAEEIVAGSTIFIKIVAAKSLKPTDVEGVVKWVNQGGRDFIGGIEANSQSDEDKLANLIAFTLGL